MISVLGVYRFLFQVRLSVLLIIDENVKFLAPIQLEL